MEQTHKINKVEIRNLRMEDYDQLKTCSGHVPR